MQPEFVQTSMGIIGSLGFALLFGIRGTKPLGCIALGSGIGWIVYLVSVAGGHGKAFGMLASSLVIAACSEILARVIKTPVILLLVPMLIPEIPGGDLYYTMYSLVEGDTDKFASLLQLVLAEAGAAMTEELLMALPVKKLADLFQSKEVNENVGELLVQYDHQIEYI